MNPRPSLLSPASWPPPIARGVGSGLLGLWFKPVTPCSHGTPSAVGSTSHHAAGPVPVVAYLTLRSHQDSPFSPLVAFGASETHFHRVHLWTIPSSSQALARIESHVPSYQAIFCVYLNRRLQRTTPTPSVARGMKVPTPSTPLSHPVPTPWAPLQFLSTFPRKRPPHPLLVPALRERPFDTLLNRLDPEVI